MAKISFHVDVHEEEDGSYWAKVEELPGCFASGFSMEELQEALLEAMQMCLPEGIMLGEAIWSPAEEAAGKPAPTASRQKKGDPPKHRLLVCA